MQQKKMTENEDFHFSDLISPDGILTRKIVICSYIVDDFISKKNLCFCKTRISRLIRNFTRKVMVYSFPILEGNLCKNIGDIIKEFYDDIFCYSSMSSCFVNLSRSFFDIIVDIMIDKLKSRSDLIISGNSNYIPISDFEDLLEEIITYMELMILTACGININCKECIKDTCINVSRCKQHEHKINKSQKVHIYLFNDLLNSKDLISKFKILFDSIDSIINLSELEICFDGRYIKYRNGVLEKLSFLLGSLNMNKFKKVSLYKFIQVPPEFEHLIKL